MTDIGSGLLRRAQKMRQIPQGADSKYHWLTPLITARIKMHKWQLGDNEPGSSSPMDPWQRYMAVRHEQVAVCKVLVTPLQISVHV